MDSFNIQNYFKRGKTVVLTLRQGEEDPVRQWTDKDTMVLLKLMHTFLPEFQNERRRKKEVWIDVSKQLQGSGYIWTPEDCRKKWSNMLRTFKGIEEQKQDPTSSMKKVKWPFYDVMLELLSLNGSESFPEAASVILIINGGSVTSTYARKHAFKNTPDSTAHAQLHESTPVPHSQETLINPDIIHMSAVQTESIGDAHHGNHLDTNVLFAENGRYRPDQLAAQAPSSFAAYRHSLAVKSKKRAFQRKRSKLNKKGCGEESSDNVLEKFVESTNKQNEQILEKLSTFHDNALALMHERNELLREIRDSLHEDRSITIDSIGTLHQELDANTAHGTETLTLHMDPSFAGASVDGESNPNHNHPTLVISTGGAAEQSALSSFQLEDGTVLSSIDPSQTKSQLITNLGHYSNSVLQDGTVSLSNLGTILNPTLPNLRTLVSVVTDPDMLSIPANTSKRKIPEK